MMSRLLSALALLLAFLIEAARAQEDPYQGYVMSSLDFRPVKQEKTWLLENWPGWVYMPWTYQWLIGYGDEAGRWCIAHGYNGAFLDHGQTMAEGQDKLEWIERFKLYFYVDHLAGKGDLHLFDGNRAGPFRDRIRSAGIRPVPVDEALRKRLEDRIRLRIGKVKGSDFRIAYALDDEVSWGHFIAPCMWRLTEDREPYERWLEEIYGPGRAPEREGWISYDAIRPRLGHWAAGDFDCSPLMDQWTFNDALWCNLIGDLVAYANGIDPDTPCGIVGGQSPNAFGGYDYARLMRKVQFIEAYDLGGSQSLIRSFNPDNAIPSVTTHFHRVNPEDPMDVSDSIWQVWYTLAHGNRGFIGWVEGWFDAKTGKPMEWHEAMAPQYLEAGQKIGPLMKGAGWIHDGAALYYSHPSIQLGWILDAEAHGQTWPNRNKDHALGSSHLVRRAWENMLRDEGLQYDFISYVDVIREGIPPGYKVLVLPAVLCLSDAEARRIREFCRGGGTVVADYLPGLFDQHGRGRKGGGVLDDLFGVRHDAKLKARDVFQENLWVETDQDANYDYPSFEDLLTRNNTCLRHESGFHKAVREMKAIHENTYGKGMAFLLNLSPQWYNAFRDQGFAPARKRAVFMKPMHASGLRRWVEIEDAGERTHGYEITYWSKEGRTIVFVCFNPGVTGSSSGGGRAARLAHDEISIRLVFRKDVKDVRDERTGMKLGDGRSFDLEWTMNEAMVLSFEGIPPR